MSEQVLVDLDKLREIEFIGQHGGHPMCPVCRGWGPFDDQTHLRGIQYHDADCWLGNLLKETEEALAATDEGNMNEDGGTESI